MVYRTPVRVAPAGFEATIAIPFLAPDWKISIGRVGRQRPRRKYVEIDGAVVPAVGAPAELVLYGQIFHAAGPNAAGETAREESLSWSDVGLSFDPKAQLPTTQTIDLKKTSSAAWVHAARDGSSGPVLEVHVLKRPPTTSDAGIPPLSADRRLMALTCAPMVGGCLAALVPLALIGIGVLVNPNDIDGWLIAAGITFVAMIGLSGAAYMRFRTLLFRDAVNVPGALPPDQIPRIVDASSGVITGQPALAIKSRTRSTVGKLGRCWIEFYPDGVQISQGPQHAEPRWQFTYKDIVQAELVDISSSGGV